MSDKTKATAMEKGAKLTLSPNLRFPEFRDAHTWEERRLGSEGELYSSLAGKAGADFDTGEARFVTYMNVFSNTFTDPKALRFVDVKEGENQNAVTSGDVFFTISSETPDEVGMSSVLLEDLDNCYLNSFCALFRFSKDKRPNPVFTGYLLRQPLVRTYFATRAQGSTRFNLSKEAFRSLPFCVPSPAEQQKIAECLSSLDDLIVAQERKVDALKTHKKGLMQQLFPREGETQPRFRFPEFQNAGEWEEVALGEIAEIKLGKMLDKSNHTAGQLLPYLNNLAVRWNEVNTSDLPKMYFTHRELDRFGLRAGDVVVCEGGEPGRAAVWDGRLPDLKFQKAIHRVRFNVPFEPRILVLHLENLAGTTAFEMLFTGGGIKHLTGETFSKLKVPLIPHAEQQRIASCLSRLDSQITAETQKLETLKTHKKGLMQQLFPSPEEVAA